MRFRDRADAGRQLATLLREYANRPDVFVLALPRGGVPVAAAIAHELAAPLDVWLVRKLGTPGYAELAMGAISSGGIEVLNADILQDLHIPAEAVQLAAARQRVELDRQDKLFRGGRPGPAIGGRTVILVDDGLATGATMEAAVAAVRTLRPAAVIVAVPVGAPDTCERLRPLVDRLVCAQMPAAFRAVGEWYDNFSETTDDDVRQLLASSKAS